MMTRRNGFSLIELCVVLGIIAIVVVILLLTRARVTSHGGPSTLSCRSNIKEVVDAMHMYAAEARDTLPGCDPTATSVAGKSYNDMLYDRNYLPWKETFFCPSHALSDATTGATVSAAFGNDAVSYGMNKALSYDWRLATPTVLFCRISDVAEQSNTILLTDAASFTSTTLIGDTIHDIGVAVVSPTPVIGGNPGMASMRHLSGTCNVGYVDGHSGPVTGTNKLDPATVYAASALTDWPAGAAKPTPCMWDRED